MTNTGIVTSVSKNKRIVNWTVTNQSESYSIVLRLSARGAFEQLMIPTIKSRQVAHALDLVIEDVRFILHFGIKKFVEEKEL